MVEAASLPAISLSGVDKRYGQRRGIEQVDLEVAAGEVFGYLGPNGAGKTTTIRLLLDLIRPDRGRMRVLGLDPRREGKRVRKSIGYLPGELALYDQLTVWQYLAFFARLKGAVPDGDITALAERLGCPIDQRIGSLSQGNKRKVGLIQAFMGKPLLLILDEPTSGLDPLIQNEFEQWVKEAQADGQTVFLSSHNLSEVERLCGRVGIIRAGRIVALEKVESIKQRSLRKVEIRSAIPLPLAELTALPRVRVLHSEPGVIRLQVQGEMAPLVSFLGRFPILDMLSEPLSLEELFLAYYGEDGHDS